MIVGALMIIASAFGAQASCTGNASKCAFVYVIIMMFVMGATIVLCALVFRVGASKESLDSGWNLADAETRREIQDSLNCCGFSAVDDRVALPCQANDACQPKLHDSVEKRMTYMMACAFGLLAFEVLGLVTAICTLCFSRKSRKLELFTPM